jgi:TolA-binding protein
MRFLFLCLSFVLFFCSNLFTADDAAKGHYDSAMFFLQNQKYQQAVEDLRFIAKSFPDSPLADDALLQLGVYYLQQEKDLSQALDAFQAIKDHYTNSNSAPAAYFYLGEIYLARRNATDLNEAYANFERVARVFPSSTWVDKSLVGAGMALESLGEYDKAYDEFSKLKVRFPGSSLAPMAQFEMGLCGVYSHDFLDATYNFQQVIDRFPESPYSKRALDFNTLIYRLYISPPANKKNYSPDPAYTAVLRELDEPTAMVMDQQKNLYVSDKGKKTIYVFDAAGKLTNTLSVLSPYSLALDASGSLIVLTDTAAMLPDKTSLSFSIAREGKQQAQPLQELRSIARNQFGDYFVVSNQQPGIFVFDRTGASLASNQLSKMEKEFLKVRINNRNQIFAMDKQRKQIVLFSPEGQTLFGIGPSGKGYEFDRIEDFEIDQSNHLYLLTKNPRGVLIFSPDGHLMNFIASVEKSPGALEDPRLLAVSPSGSIYILDKSLHRILKLG